MRRISRKRFLGMVATVGGASALGACDRLTTDPDTESGSQDSASNGPEAPSLAKLVKDGKLPPVKDRLPEQPRVIEPADRVGTYGGTWRTAVGSTDSGWIGMSVDYEQRLVGWDPQWQELVPFVAESYEIEDDGRAYHFTLRKGLKWSDGTPFTADDLVFWHDAFLANTELTPVASLQWGDDGAPLELQKHDDFSVSFIFQKPHGLFLHDVAWTWPGSECLLPMHYLKDFHPDYNPDAEQLAADAGLSGWVDLFEQKRDKLENPELPRLSPWLPRNPFSAGVRMAWERNPYYFAVDPEGSQLPYLDEVTFTIFNDPEPLLLSAANGDIDMYMRDEATVPQNKPVLAPSAETNGYHLLEVKTSAHNTMGICFNLSTANEVQREIYNTKDFRIGLSHAINRQEIIDAVFQRQGRPWQTAPRPEAPFYDSDEMGTQYTEYDPDLANEHLDRAGYAERDGNNRRLGPDGRPITVSVMVPTRYPLLINALELIKQSWAQVGIELQIDAVDQGLFWERMEANDVDCSLDAGQVGYLDMIRDPRWLFTVNGDSLYAPLWVNWYNGLTPSERPPDAMVQQMEIYRSDVFEKSELQDMFEGMRPIIEIARDEFWTIGISLPESNFAIIKDSFHNVPDDLWMAHISPGITNVSQYFTDDA